VTATLDRAKPKLLVRDLKLINLAYGGHGSRTNGLCALEAAAWLAGEPHSDHPECVSPVIAAFMRSWNDSLKTDDDRDRLLKPLLKKILNTRGSAEAKLARAMMCVDWAIREWLPEFLSLTPALEPHAAKLRAAKPIQTWGDFDKVVPLIAKAKEDAAAARDAAWDAAWDAARDAAWDAAWDAARDAAWDAAWDAASKKLEPSVSRLQKSAVALVERMCAIK
jgi:hypothetical protein